MSIEYLLLGIALLGVGFWLGHLVMGKRHYVAGYTDGVITSNKIQQYLVRKGVILYDEDKFNALIKGKETVDGIEFSTVHRDPGSDRTH